MVSKDEIRNQLVERAQAQGAVSYDDILALMPEAEHDVSLLDDLMEELIEAGVEVLPTVEPDMEEPAAAAPRSVRHKRDVDDDEPDVHFDEEATLMWLDTDIVEDAGYQQALDSDDVVGLYLKEAGRVPLLTADEEVSLAQRMEAAQEARDILEDQGETMPYDDVYDLREIIIDGEEAQEHLIRANARLVISVAKKYIGRGVPFLDLIQEGNIGLIRATNKFEWQRGHKFSTYATWWIRQAVSRAVADQGRTIRVPVHMGDQLNRMRRVQLQLTQEMGRDPTIDEIAVGMETTPDKIENLLEIARRPVSL